VGARLGQNGPGVQTFSATDRWLHRPVIMVFDTGSGGRALTKTCQSMARVFSPNLIDIYDRGGNASYRFVVCEHPATTVAALVQQPDSRLWNEGLAIATAKQLAVALSDLHRSGVETRGLHLGSIGIDGSGRVRLSPWPLAESPASGDGSTAPMGELDLVAWVLESGAYPAGSRISPTTAGLAARLRERSREGAGLTLDQLRAALGRLEPSVYDRATGEVPAVTGSMAATGAEAATGMVSATATAATNRAEAATGIVPATGAVAFGQDVQAHIYRRRRRRARWPLAAGVGFAGLVAFLAVSLGSSSSPSPAAATTNGAGACVSTTKGCPTGAASQSPTTTTTTTAPVTPVTTPDSGSGIDVAAAGATTTTTTEPSPTTTTTTTTVAPSTTTTTAPESTTTTTAVPSTTTTTAPAPATPNGQSAPAAP
jgi:hypothetical protein